MASHNDLHTTSPHAPHAQPTPRPHANHQLFSDHYLGTRLPLRPEWRALAAEAEAARAAIRDVLAAYTPSANEAQTEDGLIKPVLRLLGHSFEIQAPLATPDGVKKPDYVLYRDEAAQVANRGQKLTDALLAGRAIAVADAKYWDRPLDMALRGRGAGGTSGPGGSGTGAAEGSSAGGSSGGGASSGDPFTNRNPSYQIAFYMQHSGVDWGVLTNGRLWRLYHRDSAHKLDRFYEVDLPALVAGVAEADRRSGAAAGATAGAGAGGLPAGSVTPAMDRARVEAVLNLNVLDPAMGSGHFLVEAAEAMARFLVALDVAPDADAAGEADLVYWRRRAAQNCVYGVDLNPLAVELAKLSLWLITASRNRPLSFLDHHLRPGNALVGARIDELAVLAPARARRRRAGAAEDDDGAQLSMLDDDAFRRNISLAVDAMWLIEGTAGDTVDEVREQERLYGRLREELTRRYAQLADLSTATSFGVAIDPALWRPLAEYATGRSLAPLPRFAEWLAEARDFAERHRPFHWDLEFPEVFFDRFGQPLGDAAGFDVVIGNPPYIRQEQLAVFKPWLQARFAEVYWRKTIRRSR